MKNVLMPIALGVTMAACSTLTPTDDPVYLRMTDLEARVVRIERVIENQSLVQLASEIDRLRTETAALRGELETLRYETESNATRQRDLYVDVDRRLQSLEQAQRGAAVAPQTAPPAGGFAPAAPSTPPAVAAAAPEPAPAVEPEPAPPPRPVGSDQQNYQAAFDLIQARRYPEAGQAFTEFLANFPDSPLADNAQYWLGETYYVQRQFDSALAQFQKIVDEYPQSTKMPDALLKIGYCQAELGNQEAARSTLQQVMRQFPQATVARLASQRLERL